MSQKDGRESRKHPHLIPLMISWHYSWNIPASKLGMIEKQLNEWMDFTFISLPHGQNRKNFSLSLTFEKGFSPSQGISSTFVNVTKERGKKKCTWSRNERNLQSFNNKGLDMFDMKHFAQAIERRQKNEKPNQFGLFSYFFSRSLKWA